MVRYTLVIGNKAYSSWSLRAWLPLKHCEIPFDEARIALYEDDTRARIGRYTPAGKVPVLVDGETRVWDSLAILEYLAERHPALELWPQDPARRAHARSLSAEMHAGFTALRQHMTMNVRRSFPGAGRTPEVAADIARIEALWRDALQQYGGPFLFGDFTIADAMYAPVATRFRTYGVILEAPAQAYAERMLALPAMQAWYADAARESESIAHYENRV